MTATRAPFVDVEKLVQEELSWSPSPNPRTIAERAAGRVEDSQLRSVLATALTYVVRRVAARNRGEAVKGRKVDATRLLAQPVCLGGRGWGRYGQLSRAALVEQVGWHRDLAARETAEAVRCERLIEALEAAEVDRVEQLGLATVTAIVGPP